MLETLTEITLLLGLIHPCIAPWCHLAVISHGSYNCASCSISGPPHHEKVKGPPWPCECTYSCDTGYTLSTPTNPIRRCFNSGNWDEAQPSCTAGRKPRSLILKCGVSIGLFL